MVTFYRGFLDGSVHALYLAVRPRMFGFCQPVFNTVLVAAQVEHMRYPLRRRPVTVARRVAELAAVVSQDRMDLIRNGFDQVTQEDR